MSRPGNLEVNNTRCRELIDQPKQGACSNNGAEQSAWEGRNTTSKGWLRSESISCRWQDRQRL